MDDLPLQVGERHLIVIDNAQGADAGTCQIKQRRRAQTTGTDDEHARALERRLTRPANLAHDNVAGVTFDFLIAQPRPGISRIHAGHVAPAKAKVKDPDYALRASSILELGRALL